MLIPRAGAAGPRDSFRNRKARSFGFVRTRLVLLDFILENQEFDCLETE
jgi:hypothetical protein